MKPSSVPSFAELVADCHHSAVHLEMRDVYGVESEKDDFAEWRATRRISSASVERRRPWLDLVRKTVGRGVVMRRARVVSTPVSEYIRYEHAGTHLNEEAGEQVRWLPRKEAAALALPGTDLWLLDGRVIRFGHFGGDGALTGHELNEDPAVVKMCADAFESVWERAVPHRKFTL